MQNLRPEAWAQEEGKHAQMGAILAHRFPQPRTPRSGASDPEEGGDFGHGVEDGASAGEEAFAGLVAAREEQAVAAGGNGDTTGGVTAATGGWVSGGGRFGAAFLGCLSLQSDASGHQHI